jgi:hypothetical protein
MHRVFLVKRAILLELQLLLNVPPVLFRGVVPPLTFRALKRDQLNRSLLL